MAKLRLGVIGAGSWTVASHLPNLARHAGVIEFTGVSRLGRPLLEKIRDQYGFAVASEDYRDVLAAGVDLCVVASPSSLHHQHATAALEAGAHVLVEKPVTIEPWQAWDLVNTARRVDRHVVVSFGWNYFPMVREARRLMTTGGGIGEVEQVTIHMASHTRELLSNRGAYPAADPEAIPEAATWTDPALSGGGYGQAQLSHALGLALWLTGLRGKEAFAFMSAPLDAPVELHDAIALRYDNGAIGTLAGGSCHRDSNNNKHQLEVRAIGSEGQLHIDLEREIVWRYRGPQDDVRVSVPADAGVYNCQGPIDALVELALGYEVENCSPIELGARTVEILDAAYRSACSGVVEQVQR
ncbi:MAG TPA: Gfo/Idh/MocA family oxidoreductase [Chloroflexota bacterium]|nr:Gfo/Idh/MocA family oxidoreductase [Chloroflexota bacterium]